MFFYFTQHNASFRSLSTETCFGGSYAKVWRSSRPRNSLPEIYTNQPFFKRWNICTTEGSFLTSHNHSSDGLVADTKCTTGSKIWKTKNIKIWSPSLLFLKQIAILIASQPKAVILASTIHMQGKSRKGLKKMAAVSWVRSGGGTADSIVRSFVVHLGLLWCGVCGVIRGWSRQNPGDRSNH